MYFFPLMFPSFTERTKRLWCAVEARQIGWGGISIVHEVTGVSISTIRKGIVNLEQPVELTPIQSRQPVISVDTKKKPCCLEKGLGNDSKPWRNIRNYLLNIINNQ